MTTIRLDRSSVLRDLRAALAEDGLTGLPACLDRMLPVLGDPAVLPERTVLVAYGGGKDSAFMLAFVRAVQLELDERFGATFALRVVTMRHAGVPHAVLRNIHRTYEALHLYPDPDCTTLVVEGNTISPFDVDAPPDPDVVATNRTDVLMAGHRTGGDGRPTFCNACNVSVANSFGRAAAYDGGVDVVITGDSPEEQRTYLAWINRLARRLGRAPVRAGQGFGDVLATLDGIGRGYFGDLYRADGEPVPHRTVAAEVPDRLTFFSIFDDTAYASGDHWGLLTGFLGFVFDEEAFNFTESDCANPALMAHLRGLKAEHVHRRHYDEGVGEYVTFALGLMRRKDIPNRLIEMMRERYAGPDAGDRMRSLAATYAEKTFGLTDENLVCMVHTPFVAGGTNLAAYVAAEQPGLRDAVGQLHAVLGGTSDDPSLTGRLERMSGLPLTHLRTLYGKASPRLLDLILDGDPHKAVIHTRHRPDGPVVSETISGR